MSWPTFWAILTQTHLVTLAAASCRHGNTFICEVLRCVDVHFQIANFQIANFQIADFQIANFQIADFQIANFHIANFQIANF
jgi:uncharacterized protein YjbI with pentapeptide repeats